MAFNTEIKIGNRIIGFRKKPLIIAEMACAHNGDFQQAIDITKASASAGADVIQFQFFVPEHTVTPKHEAFEIIKNITFSDEQWVELTELARGLGLLVFVCTYDVPSVKHAAKLKADGIKLNSSDLSNPEVLKEVANSRIPFTLGTGASKMEEVKVGLDLLQAEGAEDIVLMHGVQNFPTKTEDLHINRLHLLQDFFPNLPIGYADHTEGGNPFGMFVDLLAVSKGAAVLEKHITLSRAEKGIDYQAALEPSEFAEYVNNINSAFLALGTFEDKPFSESDLKYRKFQKKSIVAIRDLKAGTTLKREDVEFIRNSEPGIAPTMFAQIEGRVLNLNIAQYDNLDLSHFTGE